MVARMIGIERGVQHAAPNPKGREVRHAVSVKGREVRDVIETGTIGETTAATAIVMREDAATGIMMIATGGQDSEYSI
jgi:predicted thioesterase